ncbi:hypothetical protein V6Z98_007291 [Aspergillus fumigatus]
MISTKYWKKGYLQSLTLYCLEIVYLRPSRLCFLTENGLTKESYRFQQRPWKQAQGNPWQRWQPRLRRLCSGPPPGRRRSRKIMIDRLHWRIKDIVSSAPVH